MLVSINHLQLIIYTGLLSEVLVDDTFPTIFEDYVISGRSLNLQNELVLKVSSFYWFRIIGNVCVESLFEF